MKWRPFCEDCGETGMIEYKGYRRCVECRGLVELREVGDE